MIKEFYGYVKVDSFLVRPKNYKISFFFVLRDNLFAISQLHTLVSSLLTVLLEMISVKIWETPLSWHGKCSLPVAVRDSKTRVFKLPSNSSYTLWKWRELDCMVQDIVLFMINLFVEAILWVPCVGEQSRPNPTNGTKTAK